MKQVLFALLFFPQLALAQYDSKYFRLDSTANTKKVIVMETITQDAEIPFGVRTSVSGLSVSGRVSFEDTEDSYVRIIMKDDHNYEYLVYENYPLLADDMFALFQNTAIETKQLEEITPKSIRVELKNATLALESLNYAGSSVTTTRNFENETVLQREQNQYIINRLNKNLAKHNKTWRAGMTSVAEKTYEEKKIMYGGNFPQLYGLEYYTGGIFVMPGALESISESNTRNTYVSEWDWRDRHGKNWMTPVKAQGFCPSCWAFAAVGVVESYVNLYYNRLIHPDLSEQEMISCTKTGCKRGRVVTALVHIRDSGIVNEQCFQYVADSVACNINGPDTLVFINNYSRITLRKDSIRKALFKNPLVMNVKAPWSHSVVLVGYKTIEVGDIIHFGHVSDIDSCITVDSMHYQNYIGQTAWLLKNNKGVEWGEMGYMYAIVDTSCISRVYSPTGNITCAVFDDDGITCADADGDGYYFWGIGNKPSWCPAWIPETKDGDDSNHTKGQLYLEPSYTIGDLEPLNPDGNTTLQITGNTTYNTRQSRYSHIRINSNATLTVKNILNLFGRVTITIESGGQLVIDGGVVTNTDIAFSTGGKLKIKNGGKLVMRTNTDFEAPIGALVEIEDGIICKSNDF
jgi:C1A family cysteine protease